MYFQPSQIESLASNPAAYVAGKKLSNHESWISFGHSERALWGLIKGSGASPYFTQIDLLDTVFKCSCPSRQFPCKHGIGLMLLFASIANKDMDSEPEWVTDWLDKRSKKALLKEEKEIDPDDQLKKEIAKEKRHDDRIVLVDAGVAELQLWLSDLIKGGLLELPNKPKSFFDHMAARMVDAKAPGLAAWVRSLGNVDYTSTESWFHETISLLGKLNLLLKSWKNRENLSNDWQLSIKNLMGWNQNPKELLADDKAYVIKDHWLVLGQEKESIDDLLVLRTWLWGIDSNKSCLVLNFGTPFSHLENNFVIGTVQKSEVGYFPGQHRQRGIIRSTIETKFELPQKPLFHSDFKSFYNELKAKEAAYPWLNNEVFLIENVKHVTNGEHSYLSDKHHQIFPIVSDFNETSIKKWILNTGNHAVNVAFVVKGTKALPLGIFNNHKYEKL